VLQWTNQHKSLEMIVLPVMLAELLSRQRDDAYSVCESQRRHLHQLLFAWTKVEQQLRMSTDTEGVCSNPAQRASWTLCKTESAFW
jgi:hypothetical protein